MFDAAIEHIEHARVTKYGIARNGVRLSYAEVLESWQADDDFRSYFATLLADSPFPAYRWETPPLTIDTIHRPFEFVLINAADFAARRTDRDTYEGYFSADDANHGVVTFESLGKDATLVVPSPRTDDDAYGHLAAFVRQAPMEQIQALWRVVGEVLISRISDTPIWLSTAGGGVAWLHIRLDSRPKYYASGPYRRAT